MPRERTEAETDFRVRYSLWAMAVVLIGMVSTLVSVFSGLDVYLVFVILFGLTVLGTRYALQSVKHHQETAVDPTEEEQLHA